VYTGLRFRSARAFVACLKGLVHGARPPRCTLYAAAESLSLEQPGRAAGSDNTLDGVAEQAGSLRCGDGD
jgi:hypothetical protein